MPYRTPNLRFYTTLVAFLLVASVATVLGVNRAADNRAEQQALDHAPSVCLIAVIKQISASSGQDAETSRQKFSVVFTPEWLKANCRLTDDEIRTVLEPR